MTDRDPISPLAALDVSAAQAALAFVGQLEIPEHHHKALYALSAALASLPALLADGAELEAYKDAMRSNQMTADAAYLKRHLRECCEAAGAVVETSTGTTFWLAETLPMRISELAARAVRPAGAAPTDAVPAFDANGDSIIY